jgi:hypothetical protein
LKTSGQEGLLDYCAVDENAAVSPLNSLPREANHALNKILN